MTAGPRDGRDFTLLWVGQAVSQFGSRTYGVAYMLWVMAATGSPALTGVIASVTLGAFTVAQLPAGWLADRADRRRVMMVSDAASASAALALFAAAAAGWFSAPLLAVAAAVLGIGWATRGVAETAALPHVVAPERLASAGAMVEGRAYAAGIAGPPAAGLLFGVSAALPFLLDAVSYIVALVSAAAVRRPLQASEPPAGRARPLRDMREGLRLFWRERFIRTTALLDGATEFAVNALGLVVITMLLQGGSGNATVGLVLGVGSAGALAGAMAAAFALRRRPPARAILVIAPALGAGAVAALATAGTPLLIALAYAGLMLLQPAWNSVLMGEWQTRIDDAHRGRVHAAIGMVGSIPLVATPAVAGLLLAAVGPTVTCVILAGVLTAVALIAATSRAVRGEPAPAEAAMASQASLA
jgi:MFS family permease